MVTEIYYSGKRRRLKRKSITERLFNAQSELNKYPELRSLKPLIEDIISLISNEIHIIIQIILVEDDNIDQRAANAVSMKVAKYLYKYKYYEKEEFFEKFGRFINLFYKYIFEGKFD